MEQTKYYKVDAEVPGSLIWKSTIDRTDNAFKVIALVYTFDRWLGDDIATSLGEFIVTERLRQRLVEFAGTGYYFDKVRVTKSEEFRLTIAERPTAFPPLPKFHWLKITGVARQNDFGYGENLDLIVSEAALNVLNSCQFSFGTAEEI